MENCGFVRSGAMPRFFQGDALCVVLCVETLNPYLLLKVV